MILYEQLHRSTKKTGELIAEYDPVKSTSEIIHQSTTRRFSEDEMVQFARDCIHGGKGANGINRSTVEKWDKTNF
jgi:hypothetical protein